MQVGTSCNDVAWEPTAGNGFDQELLDRYREYARLHLRLFPYVWTHALRMLADGRPIQRALGLAHPELGVHPNDIYLLGDALLVAPVVERGASDKTVSFPEGRWMHWLTGERFEGPGEQQVDAPLGRLPLFLRAGQLVPMLRPSIDALDATTDPARVDSYATDPGAVFVRALVDESAAFTLFDGGELALTVTGSGVSVSAESGAELKGAVYELLGASAPAGITRGGTTMTKHPDLATLLTAGDGWWHDATASVLWIALPAGKQQADVSF
jgi:alpha-D-xyloside xylohydrolase